MGVQDLWTLVQPCGRNVTIETLSGKTLAIDMSMWLTQIIKAARDKDGNMIKDAHLEKTVSRIRRLLFNKIKPIFVFDGKPPELKNKIMAGTLLLLLLYHDIIILILIFYKSCRKKR